MSGTVSDEEVFTVSGGFLRIDPDDNSILQQYSVSATTGEINVTGKWHIEPCWWDPKTGDMLDEDICLKKRIERLEELLGNFSRELGVLND